jgi:hypothetical protein
MQRNLVQTFYMPTATVRFYAQISTKYKNREIIYKVNQHVLSGHVHVGQ